MNTAPCSCHTQTAKPSLNERPRYFARQLVTPDDMTLEQDYFRARLRRHNRYLHGWGVVCGAQVVNSTKPWKVIVKAGYVLGPYGDEIFIESDQCVDVRKRCVTPETPDDEECIEAHPAPAEVETEDQWLAIRYIEKKTRLVKVPLGGCGCEDSSCEHTRLQDAYEICVIDHCPESHQNPPGPPPIGPGQNNPEAPDCPECQEEPWVVLSAFTVDEEGTVTLTQCSCRRQVLAFGDFWWACTSPPPAERRPDDTPNTGGGGGTRPAGGTGTVTAGGRGTTGGTATGATGATGGTATATGETATGTATIVGVDKASADFSLSGTGASKASKKGSSKKKESSTT